MPGHAARRLAVLRSHARVGKLAHRSRVADAEAAHVSASRCPIGLCALRRPMARAGQLDRYVANIGRGLAVVAFLLGSIDARASGEVLSFRGNPFAQIEAVVSVLRDSAANELSHTWTRSTSVLA